MFKFLFFISFFLIIISCNNDDVLKNKLVKGKDTLIVLNTHFRLLTKLSEKNNKKTYGLVELYKDDKKIFADSSQEYFIRKPFPVFIPCANGQQQLLLEFENLPFINRLKKFTFTNEDLISKEDIPYCEWIPRDIDGDGKVEISGFLSNGASKKGMVLPTNNFVTDYFCLLKGNDSLYYNPLLVYEVTPENGVLLDSTTTKKINTHIWGKFYGYKYIDTLLLK